MQPVIQRFKEIEHAWSPLSMKLTGVTLPITLDGETTSPFQQHLAEDELREKEAHVFDHAIHLLNGYWTGTKFNGYIRCPFYIYEHPLQRSTLSMEWLPKCRLCTEGWCSSTAKRRIPKHISCWVWDACHAGIQCGVPTRLSLFAAAVHCAATAVESKSKKHRSLVQYVAVGAECQHQNLIPSGLVISKRCFKFSVDWVHQLTNTFPAWRRMWKYVRELGATSSWAQRAAKRGTSCCFTSKIARESSGELVSHGPQRKQLSLSHVDSKWPTEKTAALRLSPSTCGSGIHAEA